MRARKKYFWLYGLVILPTLSDLLETGAWPTTRRSWITEVAIGLVILVLVRHIRSVHAQLIALTVTDPLTGLRNRRGFMETIEAACARRRRRAEPISLVCIDLDNFKQVNDREGHDAGDRLLRQVGAAIGASLRANVDHAFRLGGDEFALLLPGMTAADVEKVLERIHRHWRGADPARNHGVLELSAGIVEYRPPESVATFVRRADEAMYCTKNLRKPARSRLAVATAVASGQPAAA